MGADDATRSPYRIVVAVGEASQWTILLAVAVPLAKGLGGRVVPLYVGDDDSRPVWLRTPPEARDVVDEPAIIRSRDVSDAIVEYARESQPDLLLVHWRGQAAHGRYLLGRTLDPLIQEVPCDLAVVRVAQEPEVFRQRMAQIKRVLVPAGNGPNASLALQLAVELSEEAQVTVLRVANPSLGSTAISGQWDLLKTIMAPWRGEARVQPQVVLDGNVVNGIAKEAAEGYGLVLMGATRESLVDRLLFGNLPQAVAGHVFAPLIIVRRAEPAALATLRRARWAALQALPQLTPDERVQVYRHVRGNARTTKDFYVMMTVSAGLASLGLVLNSPAVIIGAMLVAPLMAALLGISMGIVQGDGHLVREGVRTTLLGTLVALAVSVLIGWLVPGDAVTAEMLARGRPGLLDLAVALLAGAVGAYAMARRGAASALPGVAIAVALAPPLTTVGLALTHRGGALAVGATPL
ncbi:MAG: DUF389 domain-containing protein, partial [Chloroflexota bacterium]